jgi:hypothetical protein
MSCVIMSASSLAAGCAAGACMICPQLFRGFQSL